jgi:hypothetical protein
VTIAAFLLVLGLVAGLARGGKLSNLGETGFRMPWLVFAGLGIQAAAELSAASFDPKLRQGGRGIAILALSYVFLIAFVAMNRRAPGALLIGAGLALNLLVIALNGGMPVSASAVRVTGMDLHDYLARSVKHRPMGPSTLLPFLGDVIPLPFVNKIVSIGDCVIGAGIFVMVERLVRYSPKRLKEQQPHGAPGPGAGS